MRLPTGHVIRHIRYEEFYSRSSDGVGDIESFCRAVDALVAQMGRVRDHQVVLDLRGARIRPLPESLLSQTLNELSRRGFGVANKVAVVFDPADSVRGLRMIQGEEIAERMGLRLRSFDDTADALEWLNLPFDDRQIRLAPSNN
jgi:hypothetical protein